MNLVKLATIALGLIALTATAHAQQSADLEPIKAANQSFYAALSGRDLKAMQSVWANKPYVVNIGPRSKAPTVGYEAVAKYWDNVITNASTKLEIQLAVTQIQSDGKLAWVSAVEKNTSHPRAGGDPIKVDYFSTNIFEKEGDRWLMILHHAQEIPK